MKFTLCTIVLPLVHTNYIQPAQIILHMYITYISRPCSSAHSSAQPSTKLCMYLLGSTFLLDDEP